MSKGKHDVHPSVSILSDITVYNKYAKYIPELQRRETWEEIVAYSIASNVCADRVCGGVTVSI